MHKRSEAKVSYLAEDVEKSLREEIESGTYSVGDKLPTESALCEKFGVSRTVVREAVAGLRAAGLVVSRRGSGVFVQSQDSRFSAKDLFAGDWSERVPEVIDALELRTAVEVQAVELAASRASMRQMEEIHEAHRAFSAKIALNEVASAEDFAFHLAIARATNNSYFEEFLSYMGKRTIPRSLMSVAVDSDAYADYMAQLEEEHGRIMSALERRDPEAARQEMKAHLLGSLRRYRFASYKQQK